MIILIAHVKGGSGKSTVTVNLAVELQRTGQEVIVVEADPTVKTASNWGRVRRGGGLDPVTVLQEGGNLRDLLLDLDDRHDVVLVDVPGKDSPELRTALTAAHRVLVPMQPTQADLDTTEPLVEVVAKARGYNPDLEVYGVLNRVSTNVFSSQAKDSAEYLKDFPEIRLLETRLHERSIYQTAMDTGAGVVELRDRKARAEIQLLTREITTW